MRLSDEQRELADRLLLTYTEMAMALSTGIDPEVYAVRKQQRLAERDAWEAKLAGTAGELAERAVPFVDLGRGQRPDTEPPPLGGRG